MGVDISTGEGLTWAKTIMICAIIICAGLAAYFGADVFVSVQYEERISHLENIIEMEINSTFYGLQKPLSFIISRAGSYTLMQNGTTGKLIDYDTNASKIFQTCIDQCEALGGGGINIKDGEYTISTQVTITEPIFFSGESYTGMVIYCNVASDYAFKVHGSAHGTVFYNLGFNGNGKTGHGIKIDGVSYCRILHCDFYNFQTAIGV